MFDKARKLYKLQKQAKQIKRELNNTHIEAEVDGIIVTINGQQEIVSVIIPPDQISDVKKLQNNLIKAFNKAIKKSQEIAAHQMKDVMSEMGLTP